MRIGSHTCLKAPLGNIEFAIDVQYNEIREEITYIINMGTNFNRPESPGSVNIELPQLSEAEFKFVIQQMEEALKIKPNRPIKNNGLEINLERNNNG